MRKNGSKIAPRDMTKGEETRLKNLQDKVKAEKLNEIEKGHLERRAEKKSN